METIGAASDRYLLSQVARGRFSAQTARNHRPAYRLLERVAASPDVGRLSEVDVDAWFAAQAGLKRSTVRARFSMLRGFARWSVRAELCRSDWTADIAGPKQPRPEPRALEADQAARLLAACPDARARTIVALMLWCGLRCCEVAQLDVADWTGDVLYVRGKGDKHRTVPVPVELAPILDGYLDGRGDGPVVLATRWRKGERLTAGQVSKLVSGWCARAGIKRSPRDGVSAHACRHTCASDVLERCETGTGLVIVRDMLGHEHLSTTEMYLRRARRTDMAAAMAGRTYAA
jgi:integrase